MTVKEERLPAHELADKILREILPAKGLTVREKQIELCHTMLDAMRHHEIALCDAGTGIGKTYAYLIAGLIKAKDDADQYPVLISTSSVALQSAIVREYIPFLSNALLEAGIIERPLGAIIRKGKNRYVCDKRLSHRLRKLKVANKNQKQNSALLSLTRLIDMDTVKGLSEYDRTSVQVRDCVNCERLECRYRQFIRQCRLSTCTYQICNHNLLIADALHRSEGIGSILPDRCALVIDEAHKLPDTIRAMFCTEFDPQELIQICDALRNEGFFLARGKLMSVYAELRAGMSGLHFESDVGTVRYPKTDAHRRQLRNMSDEVDKVCRVLSREVSHELAGKLKSLKKKLEILSDEDDSCVRYAECNEDGIVKLCAAPLSTENSIRRILWNTCSSAVLTSGTLSVGRDFSRFKESIGLGGLNNRVRESVFPSPFEYDRNCILHLPRNQQCVGMAETDDYYDATTRKIVDLINATHGHTLVLFTSYTAMSEVYARLLKARLSVDLFLMRRLSDASIEQFKASGNGVLLGTGAMWEGMDFPGDLVSSLIIPRLPFAVPDAMSEAKRNSFLCLNDFLNRVIVPDMQIKLRQGFGRAIRTETDSCVVSILDERAAPGRRYYDAIHAALPHMPMTTELSDVARFIRAHKSDEYFMETIK